MADKTVRFVINIEQKTPIGTRQNENQTRGGIYGNIDPKVKGFEGRQAIRGGVERLRNDRSRAPIQPEKWLDQIKRLEEGIGKNKSSLKKMTSVFKSQATTITKGSVMLSNPKKFITGTVLNGLKFAGPIGIAVTAIATSAAAIQKTIKTLSKKGGFLNLDWRRHFEDELTGFLSLGSQKRRDLGLDGYIISPDIGFAPIDETAVYNSLLIRDEVRLHKISQNEKVTQYD